MLKKEAEKILSNIIKSEIRGSCWKFSSGFLFTRNGNHYFDCIPIILLKPQKVLISLRYKWFNTDDLLWKILGMPENSNKSLLFHSNAAFCAHSIEIYEFESELPEITEDSLRYIIQKVISEFVIRMKEIEHKISTPIDYCQYLEMWYLEHIKKYPGSKRSIELEKVLGLILGNKLEKALEIIKKEINKNESGGFNIKGISAFELSKIYIEKII